MSFGFMSVVNRYENRKIGGKRRTSFYFAMYINKLDGRVRLESMYSKTRREI
jgi:hypothetical protein